MSISNKVLTHDIGIARSNVRTSYEIERYIDLDKPIYVLIPGKRVM